jgi:hypothetical protein
MGMLSGFPYFEVEFNKEGEAVDPAQAKALQAGLRPGNPTDLLICSHGWNNDISEARGLWANFMTSFRKRFDAGVPGTADRKFAVLAVFWPSKKFADKELIPGGAAGLGGGIRDKALQEQIDSLKGFFSAHDADAKLDKAKALVPKLENSPAAQKEFADLLRSALGPDAAPAQATGEDAAGDFFKLDGHEVLTRLSKPLPFPHTPAHAGGAAGIGAGPAAGPGAGHGAGGQGGAAGLFSFFSGIKSAALMTLNLTTYYQMKARAGQVGTRGLAPLIRSIRELHAPLRIHLVGHSFGCRLSTAAASALEKNETYPKTVSVESLSLLQAAFSHYGFSDKWDGTHPGAFRNVIANKLVRGPIIGTCTVNDKAVGLAYPAASVLAGQVAAGIGDKNDKYGGLGRNGAQKTPEAVDGKLLPVGSAYEFLPGRIHNLLADQYVKAHSDITGNEVAYAVLASISRT